MITRRFVNKLLLAVPALPAAALAAMQSPAAPKTSALGACIAASETTLSADERARVEKNIASLEQSLKVIRDFKLPADTEPAFRFGAMKSKRRV
jgi:hypothetical protein